MWSAEGDIPKEVRPGLDIDDWPFLQKVFFCKRKITLFVQKSILAPTMVN